MVAVLRQRYPGQSAEALRAVWQRSGGYLGKAQELLEGELLSPQALALAEAYAAGDRLAILGVLAPLEKAKRETVIPVLTQFRELLVQALSIRGGQTAMLPQSAAILNSRTAARILATVQDLQRALDDLTANAGVGTVLGWVVTRLIGR